MMSLFVDVTDRPAPALDFWEPIVIPRAEIEAEADRLSQLDPPVSG
jgi:gentisate 1,2-dioxygenase